MLTFEVIRRGSPDFVGLRDIFSGPLSGGPVIAMLCFVVHRLGDSRKSAREVGASRLFCFNAGFSGSPNRLSFRRAISGSIPVHKSTDKGVYLCHMLGPTASAGPAALAATSTDRLVPSIESPPDKTAIVLLPGPAALVARSLEFRNPTRTVFRPATIDTV